MPRSDYTWCKSCGRHASECGPLSHTRQCETCGSERLRANALDIAHKSGPFFVHQQRRILMAAHRALLDVDRATA